MSVITVEYDIKEDQPEGTEVFELEPSSTDLIEKLLRHRFPDVSPVDLQTLAEFSGGNARIAIVLAETIGREESVAGMSDDAFGRLIAVGVMYVVVGIAFMRVIAAAPSAFAAAMPMSDAAFR